MSLFYKLNFLKQGYHCEFGHTFHILLVIYKKYFYLISVVCYFFNACNKAQWKVTPNFFDPVFFKGINITHFKIIEQMGIIICTQF